MWMICRKSGVGKQRRKKVIAFIIAMLVVVTVLPVGNAISAHVAGKAKTSVQLKIGGKRVTGKTYRMKVGTKKKLKAVAKNKKSVRFRSSKKKVVSVSKTGVIRAKKTGTTKITAVVKTKKGKKTVWMKVKVESAKDKKTDTTKKPSQTDTPDTNVPSTNTPDVDVTPMPPDTSDDVVVTPVPPIDPTPPVTPSGGDGERILIAYFTRSGNAETLADMIQDKTRGTKFRIETVKVYPEDYSGVYDEAMKEQQENARPELKTRVDNMEDYDTVFVGFPKMEYGIYTNDMEKCVCSRRVAGSMDHW